MKVGVLSPSPFLATAYAQQAGMLMHILAAQGHDVACFAVAGLTGGTIAWEGMPIYPMLLADDPQRAAAHAPAHARHFGADVVVSVMDLWVIPVEAWREFRLTPWFPVDHFPLSPHIKKSLECVSAPIVYSKFGQKECEAAGVPVGYIPCMVDCEVFRPLPDARQALGLPSDRYIVGMVAANAGKPSRKAFFQQLRAFKLFQEKHSDALLYIHTFANDGGELDGENVLAQCRSVGLRPGKDVLFPDQYMYLLGLPQQHMALVYSAMDVLLACATGEGFCVPLIEAQACGTPVVTGSWTSMEELCFAGWTVPFDNDDLMWGQLEGYKVFPRVSAIVEALEQAYEARGDANLPIRARQGARAYDVNTVASAYWRPRLKGVERG